MSLQELREACETLIRATANDRWLQMRRKREMECALRHLFDAEDALKESVEEHNEPILRELGRKGKVFDPSPLKHSMLTIRTIPDPEFEEEWKARAHEVHDAHARGIPDDVPIIRIRAQMLARELRIIQMLSHQSAHSEG